MTTERLVEISHRSRSASTVSDWRSRLDRAQLTPIVGVAGTRGKTSVLRLVESILQTAGYRFATWTDAGVEIDGEPQRGELGPWSRALTRLKAGGLDVALQEIDWTTVQDVGAPGSQFPVVAVANLCANSEACLATPDMLLARKALSRLRKSVSASGRLILNADDFAVADGEHESASNRVLVGISPDTPILRRHIRDGGDACWLDESGIVLQERGVRARVSSLDTLAWAHGGGVPFAIQNALMATAIASSIGTAPHLIGSGLASYNASPERIPGSFNVFETGAARVIVDEPTSSWFLRTTLRAVSNLGDGRHIRVAGPMEAVDSRDVHEVGRLLGRAGGVLILHGDWRAERLDAIRQGVSANTVPPLIIQLEDEHTAVQQGLAMLRSNDVMFVLAQDAGAVVRQVARAVHRDNGSESDSSGAA